MSYITINVALEMAQEFGFDEFMPENEIKNLKSVKDKLLAMETTDHIFETASEVCKTELLNKFINEAEYCSKDDIREWGNTLYSVIDRNEYIDLCRELSEDYMDLAVEAMKVDVLYHSEDYEGIDLEEFLSRNIEMEM